MGLAATVLNNIVPISDLSRGKATAVLEKIATGAPVIIVRNNEPAAVMLSPDEYDRLIEDSENLYLLELAQERLAHRDESKVFTQEEVLAEFGITEEELSSLDDIEIE